MPAWITHLATAKKLVHKVNIQNKNEFWFGNVMPDILNNYIVKKTSCHKEYNTTHFYTKIMINDMNFTFPNLDRFWSKYKEKRNNPVVLRFFCAFMYRLLLEPVLSKKLLLWL